jgi:hypothetical protein
MCSSPNASETVLGAWPLSRPKVLAKRQALPSGGPPFLPPPREGRVPYTPVSLLRRRWGYRLRLLLRVPPCPRRSVAGVSQLSGAKRPMGVARETFSLAPEEARNRSGERRFRCPHPLGPMMRLSLNRPRYVPKCPWTCGWVTGGRGNSGNPGNRGNPGNPPLVLPSVGYRDGSCGSRVRGSGYQGYRSCRPPTGRRSPRLEDRLG